MVFMLAMVVLFVLNNRILRYTVLHDWLITTDPSHKIILHPSNLRSSKAARLLNARSTDPHAATYHDV